MRPNQLKISLRKQLESKYEELEKLKGCKIYMYNNFEAKKSECDAVLDIIAHTIDRKETEILELKEKLALMCKSRYTWDCDDGYVRHRCSDFELDESTLSKEEQMMLRVLRQVNRENGK